MKNGWNLKVFYSLKVTECCRGGVQCGAQIQVELDRCYKQNKDLKWGLLTSVSGKEFIVADNYQEHLILPISPNLTLAAGHTDKIVNSN
jgi:hypothetical protein